MRPTRIRDLLMEVFSDFGLLICAFIAMVISFFQLRSHNAKENNKLLSQLNERYIRNENVQFVVKYLREIEPSDKEPDAYQVELFLRFFEELGAYLNTKSLKKNDVKEFFDFYFERFEREPRGIYLSEKIDHDDKTWEYLSLYREIMGYETPNTTNNILSK